MGECMEAVILELLLAMLRVQAAECEHALQCRRGALDVGVVDDDVAKHLARIDVLQHRVTALILVGGEAAILKDKEVEQPHV